MAHVEIPTETLGQIIAGVFAGYAALWGWGHHGWRKYSRAVKAAGPAIRKLHRRIEALEGRPRSEPAPSWDEDENTKVRARQLSVDCHRAEEIDQLLLEYNETTPPGSM